MKIKQLLPPTRRLLGGDGALLLLRLGLGASLFARHGYEKLTGFGAMQAHFPDPLHLGPTFSLGFALAADVGGAALVALGLFTRWAALGVVVNVGVAFLLVWGGSWQPVDGEIAYVYAIGFLTILLAGAGRYSLDHFFFSRPGAPLQ